MNIEENRKTNSEATFPPPLQEVPSAISENEGNRTQMTVNIRNASAQPHRVSRTAPDALSAQSENALRPSNGGGHFPSATMPTVSSGTAVKASENEIREQSGAQTVRKRKRNKSGVGTVLMQIVLACGFTALTLTIPLWMNSSPSVANFLTRFSYFREILINLMESLIPLEESTTINLIGSIALGVVYFLCIKFLWFLCSQFLELILRPFRRDRKSKKRGAVQKPEATMGTAAQKPEAVTRTTVPKPKAATRTTLPKSEPATRTTAQMSEAATGTTAPKSELATQTTVPKSEAATRTTAPKSEPATQTTVPKPEAATETTSPKSEAATRTVAPKSEPTTRTTAQKSEPMIRTAAPKSELPPPSPPKSEPPSLEPSQAKSQDAFKHGLSAAAIEAASKRLEAIRNSTEIMKPHCPYIRVQDLTNYETEGVEESVLTWEDSESDLLPLDLKFDVDVQTVGIQRDSKKYFLIYKKDDVEKRLKLGWNQPLPLDRIEQADGKPLPRYVITLFGGEFA